MYNKDIIDKKYKTSLILHNIRSIHNVGAIWRTAEALGISQIFLTGYTPQPIDRFGRIRVDLTKTSLGAEKNIPWKFYEDPMFLINKLKEQKNTIIAIEQSKNSVDYKKVKISGETIFILGNETEGLPQNILNKCDVIAEIPMKGKKESLNVSVSAGVVLFRVLDI